MAVNLSPYGGVGAQFLDNSGNVLTGGKIETYAAGTTTPQATYTTSAGLVFHSNPIILDASGRVPSGGEIWLTDGVLYKFVLKDSNNVLIATYDNISGINSNFVNFTNEQEIQTATAGQTVFNLTTTSYQPGTNSLSVFVDGVNQYGPGAQYAYLETDSDTVTFVNGLHVGASVKFTTSQLNSSGATDASQVSYEPPFTNSVSTNVELKLAQTVSVKDFGAVGDGITNDTVAFQNAINFTSSTGQNLFVPAGNYLVTSTLTIPEGTSISGEHNYSFTKTTIPTSKITFNPATLLDLFQTPNANVPYTSTAQLNYNYNISNLALIGNSTLAIGNSQYALNIPGVLYGKFSNLFIQYFRVAITTAQSQNNRFEFISMYQNPVCCVLYQGNEATTDVWTQCSFDNSANCVIAQAGTGSGIVISPQSTLSIRFIDCLFQNCTNGVTLNRQAQSWEFVNCYSEEIPISGGATLDTAMFKVGFDGTLDSAFSNLTIIGGQYKGLSTSFFLWVDYCNLIKIIGVDINQYSYAFKTTANTPNYSIHNYGNEISFLTNGFTTGSFLKFQGETPTSGTRNVDLNAYNFNVAYGGGIQSALPPGGGPTFLNVLSDQVLIGNSGGNVDPSVTDTVTLGSNSRFWKRIITVEGIVVKTPDKTKRYLIAVDNAGNLTSTLL